MSKYNHISIDGENVINKNAPKQIKEIGNNNDEMIYKPSIEEQGYNMFIDKYESDIIDLLFDLEQICERYALNVLDNKKTGICSDFVELIADNVIIKLPIQEDDYDSSNNDYVDIHEYN
jgi:hypothetical protein